MKKVLYTVAALLASSCMVLDMAIMRELKNRLPCALATLWLRATT